MKTNTTWTMTPAKLILFTLAAVATAMMTVTAMADPGRGGKGGGECRAEIKALCGDVERGEALRECIEANVDNLSAACQERVAERKAKHEERKASREAVKAACQADAASLCGGLEGRELHQCMRQNKDNLSAQCTEAIESNRPKHGKHGKRGKGMKAVKAACQADAASLCGGLEGREMFQCMRDNKDNLSTQCTDALEKAKGKRGKGKRG